MRRWITLCACILALLAMPSAVTAAVIGDENATTTPMGETGQMDVQAANMSIAAYIGEDENLTRLAEAIDVAGLYDTLNTQGPYTVFAPSNEAFNALGNETVDQLMAEPSNLTMVLQYHIIEGEYTSENLTNMTGNQTGMPANQTGQQNQTGMTGNQTGQQNQTGTGGGLLGGGNATGNMTMNATGNMTMNATENMTMLQTLAGEELNVSVSNGMVMVENATVTMKDINATNGVIHIIDQVLVPESANLTMMENQTTMPANQTNQTGQQNQTTMPAGNLTGMMGAV